MLERDAAGETVRFDASDPTGAADTVAACLEAAGGPVDLVVVATGGLVSLRPVLAALRAGKIVATANKETLVAGGHLVIDLATERPTWFLAQLVLLDNKWSVMPSVVAMASIVVCSNPLSRNMSSAVSSISAWRCSAACRTIPPKSPRSRPTRAWKVARC